MKQQIEPLLLNELDAAKALTISPRLLEKMRKAGDVPFLRLGRRIAYSVEALKAWIAERQALA